MQYKVICLIAVILLILAGAAVSAQTCGDGDDSTSPTDWKYTGDYRAYMTNASW